MYFFRVLLVLALAIPNTTAAQEIDLGGRLPGGITVLSSMPNQSGAVASISIADSDLDWTVIRAGKFVDKTVTGKIRISTSKQSGFNINVSKTDLANFAISQITDTKYIKKSPLLFSI